jgi:TPR repeat protein
LKKFPRTLFVLICFSATPGFFAAASAGEHQQSPAQLEMLEVQAAAGSDKAQMKLARMYLVGQGTAADIEKSLFYYGLAAERGIAYAHHSLARIYLEGVYVDADPARGLEWLRSAAHLGYVPAQLDLSERYQNAVGLPLDLVQAYKWVSIASSLTSTNLDSRREQLAAQMNFLQQSRAEMAARLCILGGYRDC